MKCRKIVYTYGVFDLLHPGHISLLERAKALGDYLIVGVVADKPVKDLKGKDRPIMKACDRLRIIEALRCVDLAVLQPEYDPSNDIENLSLCNIKVDILAKGDDWDYIPGTETVEKLGGKLIKLSYTQGSSTSDMVKKIRGNK